MRRKGPHKAYALYAHITWHTRYRTRTVTRQQAQLVAEVISGAAERHEMRVLAQAVLAEHVHILLSFRPDGTIASFVRDAKSESSRRVGALEWCRGYYAGSVSERHIGLVRAYIARQHAHHPHLIPPG